MNNHLELNQKLYLKPVNNRARYDKEIKEVTVKKVGRKYFELNEIKSKFNIEDLSQVSDIVPDWEVYFSKQDILDEEEFEKLSWDIKSFFPSYGKSKLSLDQLRRIKEIINE